jgi:hypothetical protein
VYHVTRLKHVAFIPLVSCKLQVTSTVLKVLRIFKDGKIGSARGNWQ